MLERIAPNDLDLLARVVRRLQAAGVAAIVFGGWAEELTGLSAPRVHGDIDLLLTAESLAAVDRLIASRRGPEEIRGKRFAHKRALRIDGIAVEITLVEEDGEGHVTRFWGEVPFRWLVPLAESLTVGTRPFSVATRQNLTHYRQLHQTTQPWRWRDPTSIVG